MCGEEWDRKGRQKKRMRREHNDRVEKGRGEKRMKGKGRERKGRGGKGR